jgi:ABC-type phosphate/phosphonate transport system substrate-binding protein
VTVFNVDGARARVVEAMREGKWDIVDQQLTAYAAAVRAEARHQAIGEAIDALRDCGGDEGDTPVRDCIAAVERLR